MGKRFKFGFFFLLSGVFAVLKISLLLFCSFGFCFCGSVVYPWRGVIFGDLFGCRNIIFLVFD